LGGCAHSVGTLCITPAAFITTLGKPVAGEDRMEERLKLLSQPQLQMVGEIS